MQESDLPFTEPIASTSRAVFTLPYKPQPELARRRDSTTPSLDPRRIKAYELAWSNCYKIIQVSLNSLHDASLDRIINFILQQHERQHEALEDLYTTLMGSSRSRKLLKTGLILGASPGSSTLIYNSLVRQLTTKKVLVSRLTSRECSNLKNALRSLIAGFVGGKDHHHLNFESDDDEDQQPQQYSSNSSSSLMVPEDLGNLLAWYKHRFGDNDNDNDNDNDKKKKKGKNKGNEEQQRPTLVILFEDLESISGKVLTQLITCLSHYTKELPLVLLLGIATTSTNAFYDLLPQGTTINKLLDVSSFHLDPGINTFNTLIKGLFIDNNDNNPTTTTTTTEEGHPPPPTPPVLLLGLGKKTFTDLYQNFKDLHFSIDSTINYLQYLYLNHYLTSPLALLTTISEFPNDDDELSVQDLLKKHAPSLGGEEDEALSVETVAKVEQELKRLYESRGESFECLVGMVDFWEKKKKLPVETLLNLTLGTTTTTEEEEGGGGGGGGIYKVIEELGGLVLQSSSNKLPNFLNHLINRLTAYHHHHQRRSPTASLLVSFLESQSIELKTILSKPKPSGRSNLINTHLTSGGTGSVNLAGFGGGIHSLDREFSQLAKRISERLKLELKSSLKPITEVKGYELFTAQDSNSSIVSKRLNPSILPNIFKVLNRLVDPLSINSEFHSPTSSDSSSVPLDLAICFRVYRDLNGQGRLINLGDWWTGFELGVADEPTTLNDVGKKNKNKKRTRESHEVEEEGEENSSSSSDDDDEDDDGPSRRKQARFLRAVADLSHLGFVQPSSRKPEHLLKSVY